MADPKIRIRRSSTPNKVPNITQLELGELAINTYDGKIYLEQDQGAAGVGNTVVRINPWNVGLGTTAYNISFESGKVGIGTTVAQYNLDVGGNINFTGSLFQDGSAFTSGVTVKDEGSALSTQATALNFVGNGVVATGNGAEKTITITSGTGAQGATGATGAQGAAGAAGAQGATAAAGAQGAQGYQGASGGGGGGGGASVTVSSNPPNSPSSGDLWWDSDVGEMYVYYADGDSNQWVETSGGSETVVVSDNAPSSPNHGDLWWESDTGQLKIYYNDGDSAQWVDANAGVLSSLTVWQSNSTGINTTSNVGFGTTTASAAITVGAGGTITVGTGVTIESSGQATFVGVVTATSFVGSGANLTGISAGFSPDAQGNLVAGTNAGDSFTGTDAENNILLGLDAGTAITTADGCIFIGQNAGEVNTTRSSLVAIGNNSGTKVNNAYGFTAVGDQAGKNHQTGQYSTYIGKSAGRGLTGSATDNTIIGGECHYNATSGSYNVSVGKQAMSLASDANNCTAVGTKALQTSSQGGSGGDNNTALGYEAGDQLVTGSNCTILGFNAQASSTSVSNEITLGNANVTKFRVPGIGVTFKDNGGTPTQGHVLTVDANGEAGFAAASGGGLATSGGTLTGTLNSRDIIPTANNSYDLGSTTSRWQNVYTTDLQLSNKGKTNDVDGTWGDYTIQEGESDLFLINNRNGKKYQFMLKEIS